MQHKHSNTHPIIMYDSRLPPAHKEGFSLGVPLKQCSGLLVRHGFRLFWLIVF